MQCTQVGIKKKNKNMYKRILLKLSGESLMGKMQYGIDPDKLAAYTQEVKTVYEMGVQIGIVIGGGNIFRGLQGTQKGYDRVRGDQMGMLATTINALALQSAFEKAGLPVQVLTAIRMEPIGVFYDKQKAMQLLNSGHILIFAGGTGSPFFTTDTAAALRAIEMEADILLKGTRVDGVYSADPEKDPRATKFETIGFKEVLQKNLRVMDLTAITMCMENQMPLCVFDMDTMGNLTRLLQGEPIGTTITLD